MSYYEIYHPYYALLKAKSAKDAVKLYIKIVAGEKDEFDDLLKECKQVPDYYASARLARSEDEDGKLIDLEKAIDILKSDKDEVLLIDGALF